MNVDTALLRKYLSEKFNVSEFDTFLADYFPLVFNDIPPRMLLSERIEVLLGRCRRDDQFPDLFAALKRERPDFKQSDFIIHGFFKSSITQRKITTILSFIIALLLVGILTLLVTTFIPSSTPTPTSTQTSTPTQTLTSTPIQTLTSTPTSTQTSTPTSTSIPTPTSTPVIVINISSPSTYAACINTGPSCQFEVGGDIRGVTSFNEGWT